MWSIMRSWPACCTTLASCLRSAPSDLYSPPSQGGGARHTVWKAERACWDTHAESGHLLGLWGCLIRLSRLWPSIIVLCLSGSTVSRSPR